MRAIAALILIYLLLKILSSKSAAAVSPVQAASPSAGLNPYLEEIQIVAQAQGVPAAVLYAIAATEQGTGNPSQWNPQAVNETDPYGGAWGLTQVLAQTAAQFGIQSPQELFDPTVALTVTAEYLRRYSPNVGNIVEDAQAYNAGPGAAFVDTAYITKAQQYYDAYNAGTV